MAKSTGTNIAVTDASERETSMKNMNRKRKQIMELSDEEDEEVKEEEKDTNNNKEDNSKVNEIKHEIKSIDGFFAEPGN